MLLKKPVLKLPSLRKKRPPVRRKRPRDRKQIRLLWMRPRLLQRQRLRKRLKRLVRCCCGVRVADRTHSAVRARLQAKAVAVVTVAIAMPAPVAKAARLLLTVKAGPRRGIAESRVSMARAALAEAAKAKVARASQVQTRAEMPIAGVGTNGRSARSGQSIRIHLLQHLPPCVTS